MAGSINTPKTTMPLLRYTGLGSHLYQRHELTLNFPYSSSGYLVENRRIARWKLLIISWVSMIGLRLSACLSLKNPCDAQHVQTAERYDNP
jgi:hypothetical protein